MINYSFYIFSFLHKKYTILYIIEIQFVNNMRGRAGQLSTTTTNLTNLSIHPPVLSSLCPLFSFSTVFDISPSQ